MGKGIAGMEKLYYLCTRKTGDTILFLSSVG